MAQPVPRLRRVPTVFFEGGWREGQQKSSQSRRTTEAVPSTREKGEGARREERTVGRRLVAASWGKRTPRSAPPCQERRKPRLSLTTSVVERGTYKLDSHPKRPCTENMERQYEKTDGRHRGKGGCQRRNPPFSLLPRFERGQESTHLEDHHDLVHL